MTKFGRVDGKPGESGGGRNRNSAARGRIGIARGQGREFCWVSYAMDSCEVTEFARSVGAMERAYAGVRIQRADARLKIRGGGKEFVESR